MNYKVGDKVEYCYRSYGQYHYAHGYIKAVRRRLFTRVYVINRAKSEDVHICSEKCIFNKVERQQERADNYRQRNHAAE